MKELCVEYVKGYTDASKDMSNMINMAIKHNNGNPLATINEIIFGMYKQLDDVECLVDELNKQIDDIGNEPVEDFTPESLMSNIFEGIANGKITVIVGGM